MHRADEILDYWFAPPESPEHGSQREFWFGGGPKIDDDIQTRFLALYEQAATGAFDHWKDDRRACLALILLFDQFPRNMFRDTPRAFATDPRALALAKHAVAAGFDRASSVVESQFFYLPFEHSENLEDQRRAVELFRAQPDHDKKEDHIGFAERHMEVIGRFGRFPHRNEFLARESLPEEIKFLAENADYIFGQNKKDLDPPG